MTLRLYSNETQDVEMFAEIKDIDNKFGYQIDRIFMDNVDTSVPFIEGEPALIKYCGISEVRIICNNVFIASTAHDQMLTVKFFKDAFGFDFNEDLNRWIPQIKRVAEELNKIPKRPGSYWYLKN